MAAKTPEQINDDLLRPLSGLSASYVIAFACLAAIVVAALMRSDGRFTPGSACRGFARQFSGAFYITNFVFWIGLSHAGTLISAILRLANATWRRPVTRCAEVITVFALSIGAAFPVIHLGRPWLAFWLFPYPSERGIWPNIRSPLLWDFFAINTYLLSSTTFLLLPMLPDLALVRDRATGLKKQIYGVFALGWTGTPQPVAPARNCDAHHGRRCHSCRGLRAQHRLLGFRHGDRPMWHSTIFAPYFVAGAIFSGIAALIIAMACLRKFLHLEEYLLPMHFENLGKATAGDEPSLVLFRLRGAADGVVWQQSIRDGCLLDHADRFLFAAFWTMIFCNFLIPFPILAIKKLRTITGTVIASCGGRRRHVARAVLDYRAFALAQIFAV